MLFCARFRELSLVFPPRKCASKPQNCIAFWWVAFLNRGDFAIKDPAKTPEECWVAKYKDAIRAKWEGDVIGGCIVNP